MASATVGSRRGVPSGAEPAGGKLSPSDSLCKKHVLYKHVVFLVGKITKNMFKVKRLSTGVCNSVVSGVPFSMYFSRWRCSHLLVWLSKWALKHLLRHEGQFQRVCIILEERVILESTKRSRTPKPLL